MQGSFDKAAEDVKEIASKMTDNEKLEIYGLFKQGTVGEVNTSRPGMFDLKGKAKWDAWEKCKGMSQDDAKTKYASVVNDLLARYK